MPTPLDIDALRRAGLLPNWEEDWPGQPGSPAATQNVTPVMAPPTNPATTRSFPWTVEEPSKVPGQPPQRVTGPYATLTDTQIGGLPGGIIRGPDADPNEPTTLARPAPETAVFTRGDPADLSQWLVKKGEEKAAQEAASQRRAELTARQELAAEQEKQAQQTQIQQALQGVLQTQGPLAYLQAVKNLQPPAPTGSAEGQAFGQILRTQGLPAALQWLQTQDQEGRRRGPLTPDEIYARTTAEQQARFPGGREETAYVIARGRMMGGQAPEIPLTPTEAGRAGLPMGTTRGDITGQVLTTPTQREKTTELDTGRYMLDSIRQMADELIQADSPGAAVVQGIRLNTGAFAKSNPVAATFADQRQALLGIISRQVGAERGVLTDRDIQRINDALPHFRDTRAIKNRKMAFLTGMFDVSRDARLKAINALVAAPAPTSTGSSTTPPPGGRPGHYRMSDGSEQIWDGRTWLPQ